MININNKGFTLIEIIASLVIMGIVAVVAAMGLVQGIQTYVATRINSETMQRAEYALNRIKLELINMNAVTAANGSSITFTRYDGNSGGDVEFAINNTGAQINLVKGDAAYPLLTGLSASNPFFAYLNNKGGTWNVAQGFNALHTITIQLIIPKPSGGENFTLITSVNPRNNGLADMPERTQRQQ